MERNRLLKFALYLQRIDGICGSTSIEFIDKHRKFQINIFLNVINELPIVFPDAWYMHKFGIPIWKDSVLDNLNFLKSLVDFFKITPEMCDHILIPDSQKVELFGGRLLNSHSTYSDVAFNIICILEKNIQRN